MAARKPASKAKKAPTTKKSAGKVVKRPARGYHKFKNGMLNVAPKGDEKELVKVNQNSPLLCLPPELRNKIWRYTLGGKTLRALYSRGKGFKLALSSAEPENGMALLQTCRQIYAEAALMPLRHNTFAFETGIEMMRSLKKMKTYQRKQITALEFEVFSVSYLRQGFRLDQKFCVHLPGLEQIRVCIFSNSTHRRSIHNEDQSFEQIENHVRKELESSMQGMSVELVVEEMSCTWDAYDLSQVLAYGSCAAVQKANAVTDFEASSATATQPLYRPRGSLRHSVVASLTVSNLMAGCITAQLPSFGQLWLSTLQGSYEDPGVDY